MGKLHKLYDSDAPKSRGWTTILYPESCNPDWYTEFSKSYLQGLAILHDKDIKADSDLEEFTELKPHYHLMILFPGPTTFKAADRIRSSLGGVGLQYLDSIAGYAQYLTHMNTPGKYQYSADEVISFGGADYSKLINSGYTDTYNFEELIKFIDIFIEENQSYWFCDLAKYASGIDSKMFNTICIKHTFVKSYLGSLLGKSQGKFKR